MKNVVLIGASGFVGSAILKEALDRGHKVTVIAPNPEKITLRNPNLTVVKGDATDPDELAAVAKGKDAVISAYNPAGRIRVSTRRRSKTIRRSSRARSVPA